MATVVAIANQKGGVGKTTQRSRPSINDIANTIPNAPQPAAQPASSDRTKLKRKTVIVYVLHMDVC